MRFEAAGSCTLLHDIDVQDDGRRRVIVAFRGRVWGLQISVSEYVGKVGTQELKEYAGASLSSIRSTYLAFYSCNTHLFWCHTSCGQGPLQMPVLFEMPKVFQSCTAYWKESRLY
jgi:hypothetical protein